MTIPELTDEQRRAAQAQIERANLVLIAKLAALMWGRA
jgi:hypothetical protein